MTVTKNILFLLLLGISLVFISCREEIIVPENIAGNINEPVSLKSPTSYSFVVNAEDISTNVIDNSPFYALRSTCFVTILGYNTGNVEIIISGRANEIMYSQIFASDISAVPVIFEGISPEYVQLKFYNFTGKLRFELNKL